MIGRQILHYRITEQLGEGGMGVVYKAEDTKLKRMVALKFLPPHFSESEHDKARFMQEAQSASALNHPNVTTIYGIEETPEGSFMAMEFVEGVTLLDMASRGALAVEQILDFGIQLCEGLKAAHDRGVIHRDIKSDNIMVTDEGRVKITDFGLAKLKGASQITTTGTKMGTAMYMSPEQAQGEELDNQTDIFSLGVVLYEMIAGELPFKGDNEPVVLYSIVNVEPDPVSTKRAELPAGLEGIVMKCLAKRRDERYTSVEDILAGLWKIRAKLRTVAGGAGEKKPSVAVLPFANMSADPEQEYFCDGMAEEITNSLSQLDGLRVVARTSAFAFKDEKVDLREVGRKLDVGAVLEGSVRKAANKVRITAQLINVSDGYHLWSERYDRELADVFEIQDEISLAIVEKLRLELLGKERDDLLRHYTENVVAYDLYLEGRFHWNTRSKAGMERAVHLFDKAIEIDPAFALAYAGLADGYSIMADNTYGPPDELFPKAKDAALRALELDDSLGEAYASLGLVLETYERDRKGAREALQKAIALKPNYATAHHWYCMHLAMGGRYDEALEEIDIARKLDPLSLPVRMGGGWALIGARRYEEATRGFAS